MSQVRKLTQWEFLLAAGVRFALINSNFKSSVHDRVEISTPLNSWKRLLEGIYLYNQGVDPYSGDLFHESPLMLMFFKYLLSIAGEWVDVIFILVDIATAQMLFKLAQHYGTKLKEQEEIKHKSGQFCKFSQNLLLTDRDIYNTPAFVAYAYLFNPYIILNCVGLTTTVFANFFLAGVFYTLVTKKKITCVVLLSIITLQSLYPALLLVPVCLQFYNDKKNIRDVYQIVFSFLVMFNILLYVCSVLSGGWTFLEATFGFILNVNDLTPNIGLFWYFFTEMFEHFRTLFITALQINASILYLIPLTLHLKDEPVFLSLILTALTAVFKSYPSLGDVGFYLALLPIWKQLFFFMQQSFIVACILVITSVLGPTVWHLWIYSGSANANFFFGVTLAFATAEIFLITDLLFAHKKRIFALKHGWPEDSTKDIIVLD